MTQNVQIFFFLSSADLFINFFSPFSAYLQYKDLNVISVDYKELVQAPCYVQAVHNVPLVGKCTKMLLLRLFRLRPDLNLRDLHVIGFSLGAQVAGHVGRLMNRTITRITGIDEYYNNIITMYKF